MDSAAGVYRHTRPLATGDTTRTFSVTDIVGQWPGPRLAVLAGMHVNEVSGIEAARRLEKIEPASVAGTLSIVSLLNTPALSSRSIGVCPVDNVNINFCFPGSSDGTYSQRVAHSLLNDWASDAVCMVDLHGADLCEDIIRYSICQMTGNPSFDREALELAKTFPVEVVIALNEHYLTLPGRSVTGRATRMQLGAFAEAGQGGVIAESDVRMHYDGVVGIAQRFGILASTPHMVDRRASDPEPLVLHNYVWIPAPRSGWCNMLVAAGEHIYAGDVLATVCGDDATTSPIVAPNSGIVLWCDTHPAVTVGHNIAGIGY